MSYCESCGRELRTGAAFCGSCGAEVLPAFVASPPTVVAQTGSAPQAGPATPPYAQPMAPRVKASGAGVALVIVGAALALLSTFMYYGWYSYNWSDGGADQGWSFGFNTWSWSRLWPPNELFWDAGSWPPLVWFQQVSFVALMITTLLCVVAAILALVRAGGGHVGGSIIRAFGIAATVATSAYIISGLVSSESRWLGVTDLAALAGAVLIIIGGGLLGPASPPASAQGAPLPAAGPGAAY